MELDKIRQIAAQLIESARLRTTGAVIARAEEQLPLPAANGTVYEAKPVVSPVTPAPSQSGGLHMSAAEKASAQMDAIKNTFAR